MKPKKPRPENHPETLAVAFFSTGIFFLSGYFTDRAVRQEKLCVARCGYANHGGNENEQAISASLEG